MQSEAVLAGLLLAGQHPAGLLVVVATTGNVLGSLVNWLLGRFVANRQESRWFPFSAIQMEKAGVRYRRYGYWSLLLSWMPLVGDPLTLVSGVMKEPLWRFLLLVTIAKGGRYIAIALILSG